MAAGCGGRYDYTVSLKLVGQCFILWTTFIGIQGNGFKTKGTSCLINLISKECMFLIFNKMCWLTAFLIQ